MSNITKLRSAARTQQQPDWPRLQAMIRELCERKGWMDEDGPMPGSLGRAVGSQSRYYQWMGEHPSVKPSAKSLRDLAWIADQEPRRVAHLAQESRWLEAGGIVKRRDGGRLTDAQHDVVADMEGLPADLQHSIFRLVHEYRAAWEQAQAHAQSPTTANGEC